MLALTLGLLLATVPPIDAPFDAGVPLIAPGKTPELTLIHTGDVIGYLDPCG